MHIDEYIQLIEASTHQELDDRLLIQDNFGILVNTDFTILKDNYLPRFNFNYFNRYLPNLDDKNQNRKDTDYIYQFNHTTGVIMQFIAGIPPKFFEDYLSINLVEYNSTMMLHFDGRLIKNAFGLPYLKAGVEVIKDVYRMGKQHAIPFCLASTANLKTTEGLIEFKPY